MPKLTTQNVHFDRPLTNISLAYRNESYVGPEVFAGVPVNKISDKYFTYNKSDWFRREVALRAPGTRAARAWFGVSTCAYNCTERALATGVPDQVQDNADAPLDPLASGAMFVTDQILLEQEVDIASDVFGTGWAASATPSVLWSASNSVPTTDVAVAKDTVVKAIGREANTGVIGRGLWTYVSQNNDILDRIRYASGPGNPAIVTAQAVAALFQVQRLLIGSAIQNSGLEGASDSFGYVWGNHLWIGYVAPNPSLMTPSAGYVFNYGQRQINRFYEDQERNTVVECTASWDVRLVATDAGYLVKSAI